MNIKPIESKIPLTDAMGVTRGMTPVEFVKRWGDWSAKFPEEKAKLNPGMVAVLDALEIVVTVETTILQVIEVLEKLVATLNKAYNAAMSCVPGVGPANAAKMVAEEAKALAKQAIDKAVAKLQELPQTVYDKVASSVMVDEGAML